MKLIKRIQRMVVRRKSDSVLFRGDDELFKREVGRANKIIEWGVGASTSYVLKNTSLPIISVENDANWVDQIADLNPNNLSDRWIVKTVFLGSLLKWGYPATLDYISDFPSYSSLEDVDFDGVDLALIDGRFRLACFLNLIIRCRKPLTILFDDYHPRKHYHLAERFFNIHESCGAMVSFQVKPLGEIEMRAAKELLERVRYLTA